MTGARFVMLRPVWVPASCLHRWKRQQRIDLGLASGLSDADRSVLVVAKQRIRDLEDEVKRLHKAAAAVEEVVPQKDRLRLVAELAAEGVRVHKARYVSNVSRSRFYDWQARPPSSRSIRHARLTHVTTSVHTETRGTCGRERVSVEFVHVHGLQIDHNTVGLLMRRGGHVLPAGRWLGDRFPRRIRLSYQGARHGDQYPRTQGRGRDPRGSRPARGIHRDGQG